MPRARKTQPLKAPPSEEYGQGAAIESGLRSAPLPTAAGQGQTVAPQPGGPARPPAQKRAGTLGDFGAPTTRPGEPINTPPGRGPAAPVDRTKDQLRAQLPAMQKLSVSPFATDATKTFARRLISWLTSDV